MTINELLKKGVLKKESTSKQEIQDLLNISERDYVESGKDIVPDWQFGIAYNGALKLAHILVRGSGYRVKGGSHHMVTISMISLVLGTEYQNDSDYLDSCRKLRNTVEYDCINGASERDVKELREFIVEFRKVVLEWLNSTGLY